MISRSSIGLIFDRHEFAYYLIDIKSENDRIRSIRQNKDDIYLIVEGTIEEFEELFADKLVRKTPKEKE